jgi:hypothetical protein
MSSARGAIGRRGTFRPCRSGFESPRADHPSVHWDHSEGTRGRRGGRFVAEGRDGDLGSLISSGMRVRFPPPRPKSRFVQWKDSGLTSRSWGFDSLTGYQFDGGRRQTVRRGAVNPVLAGSTPAVHPKLSGRWVIGSPPASGAGPWRFESSRPDQLPDRPTGRTAASDVADRGSSPRLAASSSRLRPTGRTSGRSPENRGSNPRAWTRSTKCCRRHGALVRRRRGFDPRRRLHSTSELVWS